MAYADNISWIGCVFRTIERIADVLLNACKDIGLALKVGKTKHMEMGSILKNIMFLHRWEDFS